MEFYTAAAALINAELELADDAPSDEDRAWWDEQTREAGRDGAEEGDRWAWVPADDEAAEVAAGAGDEVGGHGGSFRGRSGGVSSAPTGRSSAYFPRVSTHFEVRYWHGSKQGPA